MPNTAWAFPGVLPDAETEGKFIHIQTSKGKIVFALRPDWGENAASNFAYLAKGKFYDGLKFHRVEPGFVIQGGDPRGNGTGGPGYQFKNDDVKNLAIRTVEVQTPYGPQKMRMAKYEKGIVAMANAGRDTNGSQFFIMLETRDLPPDYSVFGAVVEGQDVVDRISVGDVMTSVTVEDER